METGKIVETDKIVVEPKSLWIKQVMPGENVAQAPDQAVGLALKRIAAEADRRWADHVAEGGYALRDVEVRVEYHISATGFTKPEDPRFEQMSFEEFEGYVQRWADPSSAIVFDLSPDVKVYPRG
jgi:hypothetical protein